MRNSYSARGDLIIRSQKINNKSVYSCIRLTLNDALNFVKKTELMKKIEDSCVDKFDAFLCKIYKINFLYNSDLFQI